MTDLMEEVTLILRAIKTFKQRCLPLTFTFTNVVPRGNFVSAEYSGVVEERPKFDLFVTENVWVGCSASLILLQEMLEHIIPVFSGKVGGM